VDPLARRDRKKKASSGEGGGRTKKGERRRFRGVAFSGLIALSISTLLLAVGLGMARLNGFVEALACVRSTPRVFLVDLPGELAELARPDIEPRLNSLLLPSWTEPELPRRLADSLSEVGWIAKLHHVRRSGDGRFTVSCKYRIPAARIRQGSSYVLVDGEGVRVPGSYWQAPKWMLIEGVENPAPSAGLKWEGKDILAGLALVRLMQGEPYFEQIRSVVVTNYGGRVDRWRTHVELATDEPNGRIRWGSAPGEELVENSVAQKLALLRENYRRSGRVDGNYLVIDISTFPDRFTIPG
jgi:hypothetical protein